MVKNEKNLEYLQKLSGYIGFGDKLNGVLESAISRELPKFTLGISNIHRPLEITDVNAPKSDYIQYELNYNRSKEGDAYFLNTMDVTLYKTGESVPRKQTFDLERDHRITALQAYKLLSGLSFEKDIYVRPKGAGSEASKSEKIPAWFKLNLDITDANGNHPLRVMRPEYGYDLEATLNKYPFNGLDKVEAIKALRNGNYYETRLPVGKKQLPVLISAEPQMKNLNVFDVRLKEIRNEEIWPENKTGQNAAPQKTTVVKGQASPDTREDLSFEQAESEDNDITRGR